MLIRTGDDDKIRLKMMRLFPSFCHNIPVVPKVCQEHFKSIIQVMSEVAWGPQALLLKDR